MMAAVHKAASSGGFRLLRTVTEPTAGAYACMLRSLIRMNEDEVTVLYDLGGGTFDVTITRDIDEKLS